MDDTLLKVFITVTTFAVVVQAGILVGLYLSVRKSSAKIEAVAGEVLNSALPAMESVLDMMVELRPKIEALTDNISESSTLVRNQLGRIDATLADALDRTRLQVIRADELLNRTMDRVEETSEVVHALSAAPGQRPDERDQHGSRILPRPEKAPPEKRRGRPARRDVYLNSCVGTGLRPVQAGLSPATTLFVILRRGPALAHFSRLAQRSSGHFVRRRASGTS